MATHLTPTVLDALRGVVILVGELDPTVGNGLALPGGSLYLRQTGDGGALYLKTGPAATDWTATSVGALTQTAADARYLRLDGAAPMTGSLTVGDGTDSSTIAIAGAAGGVRDVIYSSAGVARWIWRVDADAETGGNAGSTMRLVRRADDGTLIDSPISVDRATGKVFLLHALFVNDAVVIGTDPLGTALLRVGGQITTGGATAGVELHDRTQGAAGQWDMLASGGMLLIRRLGTDRVTVAADGDLTAAGTISGTDLQATSDRRLKRAIRPITDALARVRKLRPVWHEWIGDDTHEQHASFLAQQVGRVMPWARTRARDRRRTQRLKLMALVAELTAALQESDAQVQALTRRVATLERAR